MSIGDETTKLLNTGDISPEIGEYRIQTKEEKNSDKDKKM